MKKNKKLIIALVIILFLVFFIFKNTFFDKMPLLSTTIEITPDYQKNLSELALTIPQSNISETETLKLLESHYRDLLLALPSYTSLTIFTPENNSLFLEHFFNTMKLPNKRHYIYSKNIDFELWAQDYFEPITKVDSLVKTDLLLLPLAKTKSKNFRRTTQRNLSLLPYKETLTAPFFFEGGNITAAKKDFLNYIFIDFETIQKTRTLYNELGQNISKLKAKSIIKNFFPSSDVIFLGNKSRKENFIHLDQSVLFLDNNVAIINLIADEPTSKASIQHLLYKKQLEKLGFTVKQLVISQKDIKTSKSYLNAIPFKDKLTGQNKIIFPIYTEGLKRIDKKESPLSREDLQGNALKAFDLFLSLGYKPFPVVDLANTKQGGSLHCITNVLN